MAQSAGQHGGVQGRARLRRKAKKRPEGRFCIQIAAVSYNDQKAWRIPTAKVLPVDRSVARSLVSATYTPVRLDSEWS